MNTEHKSTYTLLIHSEEKGRSIMETVVYALFGLSAVVSMWQFMQQPDRLPFDGQMYGPDRAPHMSHHSVEFDLGVES